MHIEAATNVPLLFMQASDALPLPEAQEKCKAGAGAGADVPSFRPRHRLRVPLFGPEPEARLPLIARAFLTLAATGSRPAARRPHESLLA